MIVEGNWGADVRGYGAGYGVGYGTRRRRALSDLLDTAVNMVTSGKAESMISAVGNPSSLFESATLDSAYGPSVKVDAAMFSGPSTGVSAKVGKFVRPKLTLKLKGMDAITFAPYGEPGPTRWPIVKWSLVGVGVLALIGGVVVFRKFTVTRRK